MGHSSGGKAPAPLPYVPPTTDESLDVKASSEAERERLLRLKGRESTFLTSPQYSGSTFLTAVNNLGYSDTLG